MVHASELETLPDLFGNEINYISTEICFILGLLLGCFRLI